jgi:limonene-1,2-epoxide hydrolase
MGVLPSNKEVVMPALHVFEVKDDKISEWRQYQNFKILSDAHDR